MLLELGLAGLLSALAALAPAPATNDDCGAQVCVYANTRGQEPIPAADAGSWKPDSKLSKKARRKDAKKHRKHKDVALSVRVEGGRASVFVDGRYLAGDGPHAQRSVKPGKHEIEVRDGDRVVAVGVLSIPRKAGAVALVVHDGR